MHTPGKTAGTAALAAGAGERVQSVEKGESFLFLGPATMRIVDGAVRAAGAHIAGRRELVLNKGDRLVLEVEAGGRLSLSIGDGGSMVRLPGSTIPADWRSLADSLVARPRRRILVLGEIDTGKTFFTTWLSNLLLDAGRTVAVLDTDAGQGVVGPPGTVGYALPSAQAVTLRGLPPAALFFTGATSPGMNFLEYGVGLARMAGRAAAAAETVIINTPGWVQGDGGRLLARSHAALLAPDLVVLLRRDSELEYMAKGLYGETVSLGVSPYAVPASPLQRRDRRQEALRRYFAGARSLEFRFEDILTERSYLLSGEPLPRRRLRSLQRAAPVLWAERLGSKEGWLVVVPRQLSSGEVAGLRVALEGARLKIVHAGEERDLVISLNDAHNWCLALALLRRINYRARTVRLLSPLPEDRRAAVRVLQFGLFKAAPDGTELGSVPAGYL